MYFATVDIEQQVISLSVKAVLIGAGILFGGAIIALIANKQSPKLFKKLKVPVFSMMLAAAVGGTLVLAYNTIYLNVKSESRGPVHWHADIEFWACGSEIELRNPTGLLSNKIGTSTYHEHNDKRIHLEGVVIKKAHDASLGKFMEVTGGYVNKQGVGIPVNEDSAEWLVAGDSRDGDRQSQGFLTNMEKYVGENDKGRVLDLRNGSLACGESKAELQAFVFQFDKATKTYHQRKLTDPSAYVIRDESTVPPGDCIIVEFDKPKKSTNKLCEQYGVRDHKRCIEFGVKELNPELCNIRYEGVR